MIDEKGGIPQTAPTTDAKPQTRGPEGGAEIASRAVRQGLAVGHTDRVNRVGSAEPVGRVNMRSSGNVSEGGPQLGGHCKTISPGDKT